MSEDTKAKESSLTTGDTAPMKAAVSGNTVVAKRKQPAVFPSKTSVKIVMTYLGEPLSEGNKFHRRMEQFRGGRLPFRDKLPVLLFLAFQGCAAIAALIFELLSM